MSKPTIASLKLRANRIISSEKVTKVELAAFSREVLKLYSVDGCIAIVNNLIANLTPANKKMACRYFPAFVAHEWNAETQEFGKKLTDKQKVGNIKAKADKKLEDPDFNIFSWAFQEPDADKPKKVVNHRANVIKAIEKAIKGGDDGNKLTPEDWASILKEVSVVHPMFKSGLEALVTDEDK